MQLTGYHSYGLHIANCEGEPAKYIELSNLTFKTTAADQVGLYFDINPKVKIDKDRYFLIRDCKFNGRGEKAKLSPSAQIESIEVQPKDLLQLMK
jgi:hypothetical protein